MRRTIQVLEPWTIAPTFSAAYVAGSTATNQTSITVGGATTSVGIGINFGATTIGADKVPEIERRIIQMLEPETLGISHAAAYSAGDRKYNIYLVLS